VAGTPAQVIAQLLEGDDPMIGGGTPFTATISSTGAVTPGGGVGADGWTAIGTLLALTSTDGHTFTVSTNADLSGQFSAGARLKFTQDATTKYFIVTAITAAQLTLYGGTDYAVTGTAITAVSYSVAKVPLGFDPSPIKWTEILRDSAIRTQSAPVGGQWYNLGGLSLAVPIGAWILSYAVAVQLNTNATAEDVQATLSTGSSTASDLEFDAWYYAAASSATVIGMIGTLSRQKLVLLAAKTSYFLNARWENSSAVGSIQTRGDEATTVIQAVCAYL
jgi:hypothetical protein